MPSQRRRRRRAGAAVALAAATPGVRAGNSTVDWQFAPGSAARVEVAQCGDGQALVLSAAESAAAGVVNASISFQGPSHIELYGIRYEHGAPALIVVDGDYVGAVHVDESLAAVGDGASDACVLLARFSDLTSHTMHTLEVVLQGDVLAPMTLTIANVTISADGARPPPHQSNGDQPPPEASGPTKMASGPNIAAIVGPIVAVVLLIAGGIVLWLLRRRRMRNARKAPSAAFRAEHPDLPLPVLAARVDDDDDAYGDIASPKTQTAVHRPAHRSMPPSHATGSASHSSSGTTLVSSYDMTLAGSYGDEKKKLAEILAVRDAEELELQARDRDYDDPSGRVPWNARQRDGADDAPRGRTVAGWDPNEQWR